MRCDPPPPQVMDFYPVPTCWGGKQVSMKQLMEGRVQDPGTLIAHFLCPWEGAWVRGSRETE